MNLNEALTLVEDQAIVQFTGKINILNRNTKQQLGLLVFHEGDIVFSQYFKTEGLKAFYSIFVDFSDAKPLSLIVEPEIIGDYKRNIHYPFSILRKKLEKVLENYKSSQKLKPPGGLKLVISPEFIIAGEEVSSNEYDVLLTLSDFNKVEDIYQNCQLLDFEITDSLVSLRKKNAIKVLKHTSSHFNGV